MAELWQFFITHIIHNFTEKAAKMENLWFIKLSNLPEQMKTAANTAIQIVRILDRNKWLRQKY